MTVVGFDFGTTNSVVSFVQGGRAIACLDEEDRPVPSVVGYRGTRVIAGREARQGIDGPGLGVHGIFVRSPKRFLGRESIIVGGVEHSPIDVAKDSIEHVLEVTRRVPNAPPCSRAVVTIPVLMSGRQRRHLRAALQAAGVETVQFVQEPFAALYRYLREPTAGGMLGGLDRRNVLVCDWGGGTLDLTLCRLRECTVTQLANGGSDEVGGDYFDEAIRARVLETTKERRSWSGHGLPQPGAEAKLLLRCEEAKIELSRREKVVVYVPSYWEGDGGDVEHVLGLQEFEAIAEPLVEKGLGCLDGLLASEGLGRDEIALCLATGGMTNLPLIRRRLQDRFGARVATPDGAGTFISEGAAWVAADGAELELARHLEVALAAGGAWRRSFLPLLKAGVSMPRVGEEKSTSVHLFCTDPRDGWAKFELCAPKVAGRGALSTEPRRSLECLTVKVDAGARPFNERLEVDVRVDQDLVVDVQARSVLTGDQSSVELHDLEFAVRLPAASTRASGSGGSDLVEHTAARARLGATSEEGPREFAAVQLRPNVADSRDDSLIPGELLYTYRPEYFDVRCNPPDHQVHELEYYGPCAGCGRASDDPLCRCDSVV